MASSLSQPITSSSTLPVVSLLSQPAVSSSQLTDDLRLLPLYKAIIEGNLNFVKEFCDSDGSALEVNITINMDTALHVAVGIGMANHIVDYLLSKMSSEKIAQKNNKGNTVLSIAAIVGNIKATEMIMRTNVSLDLIQIANNYGRIPLIEAARHGQKKMIKYLLPFSKNYIGYVADSDSFTVESGLFFFNLLIIVGFYDLALEFLEVKEFESLAITELSCGESLLSAIAGKPSAFPSGNQEKPKFWRHVFKTPSYIKELQERSFMYEKSLQLVKHLCREITCKLDRKGACSILKRPLFLATELGIYKVVEEIIVSFPDVIWFTDEKKRSVFHLAVIKRQESVFNLIFQTSGHKHLLLMPQDIDGNNILHLVGKLAFENQFNRIPGTALQMQRELQWFKEVEKIVQVDCKEDKNSKGETPANVFTKQHRNLVKEGEKWMKGTATSCSVVAALIATIVFAAAITVPGDYKNDSQPNFYEDIAFKIFSISDTLSLSSSIAAIIMFLSILTTRYVEDDFLYSLPKRLIWGLFMLFLSLISLMVAFCAIVFLVSTNKKGNLTLVSVVVSVVSALVPVYMYALCQFPLLWDLFMSTYRPGIFRKQGARVLY